MRILVQLVDKASVEVNHNEVSSIGKGLLLFVGISNEDNKEVISRMVRKVVNLRIFPDSNDKTNLSIKDVNGEILCVSQFALYADLSGGNRPSFFNAANKDTAQPLYQAFVKELKSLYPKVEEGIYHEHMMVHLVNDGPFTIWLDSKELFK